MTDLDAHQSTMVSDRFVHLLAFYESVGCDDTEGMHRFDLELRVLLAFAFVNGVAESSLVPLLPSVQHDLGLSSVETGLLLTTTTLAMLVAAMPIGYAANRFGTRVPLLVAAALMPLALVGQALAGNLELLLAARLLFGLSFGILWVIGPARAAAGGRGASGTGPLIAASGVGWLVGPIVAGVIADATGWRIASAVLAVATLPLIPLVARYAAPRTTGERLESLRLRAAFGLVRRNRAIAGAALVSALLGVVGGVSGLLAAARARGQRPLGGRDRPRVRPLGRRLDRRRRRSSAGCALGRAPARRRHRRRRPRGRVAAARVPALDARARRVPARLDRLPVDDQRAQLRRRRARERGHLGADGDRRDEPRVGRDGARHPAARRPRRGKLEVRFAFAATGIVAAGVAVVLLLPRPRRPGRRSPVLTRRPPGVPACPVVATLPIRSGR